MSSSRPPAPRTRPVVHGQRRRWPLGLANPLKPKERVKIPRQEPFERPPLERALDFLEVSGGFDEERAQQEALRCLECRDPVCTKGCPVGVDIRSFIQLVLQRDYGGALAKIRETNHLPAICGRVCPQETQCEEVCTLGKKFAPVAIGKLERFVADAAAGNGSAPRPSPAATLGQRVAIVGSGPAGLTCAAELARLGYGVTVFEALHAVGGVLRYGIPEFRLPKRIVDEEADRIRALGVEILTNVLVGRTVTVDELFHEWGFAAAFLGTGAGTPEFMGIPGESLSGVYSANEFLTRVNLMGAWRFPEYDTPVKVGREVAVIGGGNTALDAVRTAKRLGASRAYLIYRRSRGEMPARAEEVHHAVEEGVQLELLTAPVSILGDERGFVTGIECQKMQLGEPDESGRRRPVPLAGSEYMIPVQTVVEAIGQRPNPIIQSTTPGLSVGKHGTVRVGERQETNQPGIFAGGDVARGGATVILAMRDGWRAATAIHEYLTGLRRGASEGSRAVSGARTAPERSIRSDGRAAS
jgi:glutamate synthase (NADPH/NADH) small chain